MAPDPRVVNARRSLHIDPRYPMHRLYPLLILSLLLSACGRRTPPAAPVSEDAARIECDRYAARAIQVADTDEAAALARRAGECYSALVRRAP